jgi:hypothetical protein
MQHLSQKQLHTLIQLEAQGRITPHQVYQRCALAKVQKADNYVSTAIAHIIGGVVLVGFAGQIVVPIVAASWLYTWLKSYRTRQDAIQRINSGQIAEFLDDDDRVSFEEDMQALTVEAIAAPAPADTIPTDAPTTEPAAQPAPAAVAVATAPIAAPPLAPTIAQVAPETTDLALAMAKRLTSRIVCAAPRTGKGMLIHTALEYVQRLRPDVELWALDIKAEPQEDLYYARFEPRRVLRLGLMGFDKPPAADKRIQAFFHAFNQSTAQTKLLWVNECVTLAAKLAPALWKQIQQFAVGLCSAGATGNDGQTGRFIWFDTQSPNVTDLGLRTNASRNVFKRVFLANDDRSLLPSAVSCGFALGIEGYELEDLSRTPSTRSNPRNPRRNIPKQSPPTRLPLLVEAPPPWLPPKPHDGRSPRRSRRWMIQNWGG